MEQENMEVSNMNGWLLLAVGSGVAWVILVMIRLFFEQEEVRGA